MKEFMRVLVEELTMGLIQGNLNAWVYTVLFTVMSMTLANKLGKFLFR